MIAKPRSSGNEMPPAIILSKTITPDATTPAIKPARNPILNRCLFEKGKASIWNASLLSDYYTLASPLYILLEVTRLRGHIFTLLLNFISASVERWPLDFHSIAARGTDYLSKATEKR